MANKRIQREEKELISRQCVCARLCVDGEIVPDIRLLCGAQKVTVPLLVSVVRIRDRWSIYSE